jgi:HEAT repeat protein
MGFLRKLFGGKDEPKPKHPPEMKPVKRQPEPSVEMPPVEEMDRKQLTRALGSGNKELREQAATRIEELGDRTAVRPLLNSYVNYGDPAALKALRSFGTAVTPAATSEALDSGVIGERKARLMDVIGASGDDTAVGAVRECINYPDKDVHVRACAALARLGDLNGVSTLSANLEDKQDDELRNKALHALADIRHEIPEAQEAIDKHIDRYLAEGGAIAEKIEVKAPRLADPDTPMTQYIVDEIKSTMRDFVVVTGSGAIDIARTRQSDLRAALSGHNLAILTSALAPEEQMDELEEARDAASSNPEHTVLVIGALPAPSDSPPLRHFLTPGLGPYTAKLIYCDPHEYNLLQDWWHYIDDQAEVDTTFEVVLSVSTPKRSAISDEEYLIYQLTPDDRKDMFPRALLAHL